MKELINSDAIPRHIAIIMDGNGRWAKKRGAARIFGHQNAIQAVRDAAEGSAELGVDYLTLYAFSTENWARPIEEVNGLMSLLVSTIKKELPTLQKNNIRLKSIGNILSLPKDAQENLDYAKKATQFNDGLTLILALNYSGRWEITEAVKKVAQDVVAGHRSTEDITEGLLDAYLDTKGIPDPELLIRTSGEMRISNFLLWQVAYTELFITEVLWPDFRREHLYEAIVGYQRRERRFGKISEQVNS
ncbi:MAG: isoprenyl transferase [Imperialibacter sp.]|uniref:Isoprenyl transferase n=1 Tax=Imperialibacter roseus TaxID=1324217 RepID=A0ABZ0IQI0_9BACT|nr:isoprenyl transferase [Imperialibacter roseus]WOK06434.1 isoprenyl transferase [Imperialibacter roseus]|tara:strand:+ start:5966 stop:6703 length:738 start_codon:yes stop_codon:yes gene_type:complete